MKISVNDLRRVIKEELEYADIRRTTSDIIDMITDDIDVHDSVFPEVYNMILDLVEKSKNRV